MKPLAHRFRVRPDPDRSRAAFDLRACDGDPRQPLRSRDILAGAGAVLTRAMTAAMAVLDEVVQARRVADVGLLCRAEATPRWCATRSAPRSRRGGECVTPRRSTIPAGHGGARPRSSPYPSGRAAMSSRPTAPRGTARALAPLSLAAPRLVVGALRGRNGERDGRPHVDEALDPDPAAACFDESLHDRETSVARHNKGPDAKETQALQGATTAAWQSHAREEQRRRAPRICTHSGPLLWRATLGPAPRRRPALACQKRSNRCGRSSDAMPAPVSRTANTTSPAAARTVIALPGGVNWRGLPPRRASASPAARRRRARALSTASAARRAAGLVGDGVLEGLRHAPHRLLDVATVDLVVAAEDLPDVPPEQALGFGAAPPHRGAIGERATVGDIPIGEHRGDAVGNATEPDG